MSHALLATQGALSAHRGRPQSSADRVPRRPRPDAKCKASLRDLKPRVVGPCHRIRFSSYAGADVHDVAATCRTVFHTCHKLTFRLHADDLPSLDCLFFYPGMASVHKPTSVGHSYGSSVGDTQFMYYSMPQDTYVRYAVACNVTLAAMHQDSESCRGAPRKSIDDCHYALMWRLMLSLQ